MENDRGTGRGPKFAQGRWKIFARGRMDWTPVGPKSRSRALRPAMPTYKGAKGDRQGDVDGPHRIHSEVLEIGRDPGPSGVTTTDAPTAAIPPRQKGGRTTKKTCPRTRASSPGLQRSTHKKAGFGVSLPGFRAQRRRARAGVFALLIRPHGSCGRRGPHDHGSMEPNLQPMFSPAAPAESHGCSWLIHSRILAPRSANNQSCRAGWGAEKKSPSPKGETGPGYYLWIHSAAACLLITFPGPTGNAADTGVGGTFYAPYRHGQTRRKTFSPGCSGARSKFSASARFSNGAELASGPRFTNYAPARGGNDVLPGHCRCSCGPSTPRRWIFRAGYGPVHRMSR